jgi:hypothetical protein
LAIRKQLRVRFTTANGVECLITESGLAQVPTLKEVPHFNLEDVLAETVSFRVEPVATGKAQVTSRDQLEQMIAAMAPGAAVGAHDHDD